MRLRRYLPRPPLARAFPARDFRDWRDKLYNPKFLVYFQTVTKHVKNDHSLPSDALEKLQQKLTLNSQ